MDPSSASETLAKLQGQVEWLDEALRTHADAFSQQESDNSRAMDIADAGGNVQVAAMPVVEQPEPGYSPFAFVEPVVSVGSDLDTLVAQLNGSDISAGAATAQRWRDFAQKASEVGDQLDSVAADLEGKNDSIATERAAGKIRQVALTGKQFAANSRVMAKKVETLSKGVALAGFDAVIKSIMVNMIEDPAERRAAEMAALSELEGKLQRTVAQSMPMQISLIDDYAATGGGDIETGIGAIAGPGERYTTDGVQWPEQLVEKAMDGTLGPGDFGAVKQAVQTLGGISDHPAVDEAIHNALGKEPTGLSKLGKLGQMASGLGGGVPNASVPDVASPSFDMDSSATAALPASAGENFGGSLGGMANGGGMSGMGASPSAGVAAPANGIGMAPLGTGADVSTQASGLDLAARPYGGPTSMNGVSGLGGPGAAMLGGKSSGLPAGALNSLGSLNGAAPSLGTIGAPLSGGVSGNSAVRAGAALGAGGKSVGAAGGMSGALRGAPGASVGSPSAGGPSAGGPGANAASSNAAGAGNAAKRASAGMGRGMMPLIGARGNDSSSEKKVKSVVTQVELEPNKKALLGESPLVVPGVIGAWVRE